MRQKTYWGYPYSAEAHQIVKTNDLRLYYAKFLANLVGNNQDTRFLEVGAGSGFTTHYLASMGFVAEGSELSEYRVNGAKLLGKLKKTTTNFSQRNLCNLPHPSKSFDVVFSCFVLEQCKEILETAISECLRVAKNTCVFFEPSSEHFTTLPSIIHNATEGQPPNLGERIQKMGYGVTIFKPNLQHFYNAGCIYVVSQGQEENLLSTIAPCVRLIPDVEIQSESICN